MANSVQAALVFVSQEMRSMSPEDALNFVEELIEELKVTAKALEQDVEASRG